MPPQATSSPATRESSLGGERGSLLCGSLRPDFLSNVNPLTLSPRVFWERLPDPRGAESMSRRGGEATMLSCHSLELCCPRPHA